MRATQQRKRFVSRELVALAANQPQAFADYSEGQYRAQIESIADEVLSSGAAYRDADRSVCRR